MKKFVLLFKVWLLIALCFISACNRNAESSFNQDCMSKNICSSGETHNEYLNDIYCNLNTKQPLSKISITPTSFIDEMAKIQSAVLSDTNLKRMNREQIIAHIERNIDVSISPEVISFAQLLTDDPNMSAIAMIDPDNSLSSTMHGYIEDMDYILKSTSISDVNKKTQLQLTHSRWYRQANQDERKLISATSDIFLDSHEYWTDNRGAWEQSIALQGRTLKSFLWGIARTDGFALIKAVTHAGWYYATMFWKEMLIASGISSAISAVCNLGHEILTSSVNGEIVYSINGSEYISEKELKTMIYSKVVSLNPHLNIEYYIAALML